MKINYLWITAAIFICFQSESFAALVAYWDFNENSGTILHDVSGNGNDGMISGATWHPGVSGSSLLFDGQNYVEISNDKPFNLKYFTVSCWIRPNFPVNKFQTIFGNYENDIDGVSPVGFSLSISDVSPIVDIGRKVNSELVTYVDSVNYTNFIEGCYHFVACTYDGEKVKLFFDNFQVGEFEYAFGVKYSIVKPSIGNNCKGNIDDLKVFDQALTNSEISALYNEHSGIFHSFNNLIPAQSPSNVSNPTLLWHPMENATSYSVKIGFFKTFQAPYISSLTRDTFVTRVLPLVNTVQKFYWKVTGLVNDEPTYFSTIDSFVVDLKMPQIIPFIPKITGEKRPFLKWNKAPGASSYTVEIGNDPPFWNPLIVTALSDTQYMPDVDLQYGTFYWHVISDASPTWSNTDTFQIIPDSRSSSESIKKGLKQSIDILYENKRMVITTNQVMPEKLELSLFTINGKKLKSYAFMIGKSTKSYLDISDVPAGLYIVEIQTGESHIKDKLLIEQ